MRSTLTWKVRTVIVVASLTCFVLHVFVVELQKDARSIGQRSSLRGRAQFLWGPVNSILVPYSPKSHSINNLKLYLKCYG